MYCWTDAEQNSSRTFAWSGSGRFCPCTTLICLEELSVITTGGFLFQKKKKEGASLCLLRCSYGGKVHQIQPGTGRSDTFLCKAAARVWLMCKYAANALHPSYVLFARIRAVCVCIVNPMCWECIRLAGHTGITCLLWDLEIGRLLH